MILSNATEATIDFFLGTLREQNPKVIPSKIMSDFDKAQIKAIRNRHPESQVFLCWWHVLHAWQQHIVISHYPELWNLLKGWIHLTDEAEFNECWTKIQALAPASFIEYIQTYWLTVWPMWSAQERQDQTIFEFSETNMFVEAYIFPCCSDNLHNSHNILTVGITY